MTPYRGAALPVVRLSRLFGLADTSRDRLHVCVVGSGAAAIGIAVDRIVGQKEIVVRAVGDALVRVDGISGATDLGTVTWSSFSIRNAGMQMPAARPVAADRGASAEGCNGPRGGGIYVLFTVDGTTSAAGDTAQWRCRNITRVQNAPRS